jgi:hypothetical protein
MKWHRCGRGGYVSSCARWKIARGWQVSAPEWAWVLIDTTGEFRNFGSDRLLCTLKTVAEERQRQARPRLRVVY